MKALSYEEYQRLSEGGLSVPVFRELPGDLRTPVSAFLSLASRAERAFLLESVLGGERLARYSFLGRDPVARLEVKGGKIVDLKTGFDPAKSADFVAYIEKNL
jgi:anthranilate synthase component 1